MRPTLDDLTAEFVRSILDYDQATGLFRWKWRADIPDRVNKRFAGKLAGWLDVHGYWKIHIHRGDYRGSRLAWLYMTGRWPSALIDHKDNDRGNNAWRNLREASHTENSRNMRKPTRNTSGFKGVSFHSRTKTWRADIFLGDRQKSLGHFPTAEAAHSAYRQAAEQYYGEFARAA